MRAKPVAILLPIILVLAALAGASLIPLHGAASTQAADRAGASAAAGVSAGVPAAGTIMPAGANCLDYRNGAAAGLPRVLYGVRRGAVGSVAPGLLTYYSELDEMPASFTIRVRQDRSPNESWPWLPPRAVERIVLYDAGCKRSGAQDATTYDPATGEIAVKVSGAVGATYILRVLYNLSAVKGTAMGAHTPVVTYRIVTWVDGSALAASQADLDFVFKK
jgi:hypothetical protein